MGELDLPDPGPGEVRIRVRASGVNRADLLQRRGGYPSPPGVPGEVPGLEYAGAVVAVGPGTHLRKVGDRVMGIVGGGGYAAALVTHERATVTVPEGMSLEDAGAVPEVFMTAFDALFLQGGLTAGETLLIHAVGSGVGTAALQLARAAGVRTLGTSRTPEKLEKARALGLDVGISAAGGVEEWTTGVREATRGGGVHLVLDLVGGDYLNGNVAVIRERGRILVVGVPGGRTAPLDLRLLMTRRGSITGTVLRARPLEERIALARAFQDRVSPLLEGGRVHPVLDTTLPAERAPEAHRLLEENRTFGKVVLLW